MRGNCVGERGCCLHLHLRCLGYHATKECNVKHIEVFVENLFRQLDKLLGNSLQFFSPFFPCRNLEVKPLLFGIFGK